MFVTAEVCGRALAMERDGSVYSCDHFIYPEYRLGNIIQDDLFKIVYFSRQQKFGCAKGDTPISERKQCELLNLCGGDCPKDLD